VWLYHSKQQVTISGGAKEQIFLIKAANLPAAGWFAVIFSLPGSVQGNACCHSRGVFQIVAQKNFLINP
jgi:hypothetical protein